MKFVVCFLVVLPLALSAPLIVEEDDLDKRFLWGKIQLPSIHDLGKKLLEMLGSDTTEAACEAACPAALNALVPGAGLIGGSLCSPACHWVQTQIG